MTTAKTQKNTNTIEAILFDRRMRGFMQNTMARYRSVVTSNEVATSMICPNTNRVLRYGHVSLRHARKAVIPSSTTLCPSPIATAYIPIRMSLSDICEISSNDVTERSGFIATITMAIIVLTLTAITPIAMTTGLSVATASEHLFLEKFSILHRLLSSHSQLKRLSVDSTCSAIG